MSGRSGNRAIVRAAFVGALLLGSSLTTASAVADEAARQLAIEHLEAGTLADGEAALTAILTADAANDDARFGLGLIQFMQSLEHLSQSLYHHGLKPPESILLPIVRLPVPPNPDPEPITYDLFRGILVEFVADLAEAEATLRTVASDEAKISIDLLEVRYDVDGDGTIGESETLAAVFGVVTGVDLDDLEAELGGPRPVAVPPPTKVPPGGVAAKTPAATPPLPAGPAEPPSVIGFDRADAIWLAGYTHVLMGLGEFFLAHDWRETFDTTFHLFFPDSNLPFGAAIAPRAPGLDMMGEAAPIADMISFIHLLRWDPTEPERLLAVRDHLKAVIELSRQNWDAIEAETDDDNEWVPSPTQTNALTEFPITAEIVQGWRKVLDEAEAVLDGDKLIPHWRFTQGINLRRVFEEPTAFDLVLWITGPAAIPYLEDGEQSSGAEWNRILDVFQGGFATYMIWFN